MSVFNVGFVAHFYSSRATFLT